MIVRMRHTRGKLSALLYTTRRCLSVAPTIANGSLSLCHLAPTNSAGSFVSCRTAVLSSQQRYKSSLPSSHVDDDDDDEMTKNAIPFPLADIGEGIAEVELMQWFVTPGDTVSQFDPICQVQSDKATVEITSRFDGVILSLEGQTGDMIQVGQPLLWIQTNQPAVSPSPTTTTAMDPNTNQQHQDVSPPDDVSAFQEQEPTEAPPTAPPTQASIDGKTKVLATPAVRKIAMDNAIDLSTIVGSGPNGRILKADLLHLSKQHSNTGEDTEMSIATSVDDKPQDPSVVPIRGYNRLMVKTMTESLNIPHMGYGDDIDMTPLLEHKKQLEASSSLCSTSRLSVLAFSVKALSLALTQYPTVNSSINIDEMTLTIHQDHNVGLAMDTPRGLAVPVVRNCQNLSIAEITEEINRLKSQVRIPGKTGMNVVRVST